MLEWLMILISGGAGAAVWGEGLPDVSVLGFLLRCHIDYSSIKVETRPHPLPHRLTAHPA